MGNLFGSASHPGKEQTEAMANGRQSRMDEGNKTNEPPTITPENHPTLLTFRQNVALTIKLLMGACVLILLLWLLDPMRG
jgi:hypothetical protein